MGEPVGGGRLILLSMVGAIFCVKVQDFPIFEMDIYYFLGSISAGNRKECVFQPAGRRLLRSVSSTYGGLSTRRMRMARISLFLAAIFLWVLCVNAPAQDRFDKLIEILKNSGKFTEEQIKELEGLEGGKPTGLTGQDLDKAIDEALDLRKDSASKIHLPMIKGLTISGQNRIRGELHHNHYMPGDPLGDARYDYIHMRTRLRFDFEVTDHIDAVVELQDVRVWGQEGSTLTFNMGATGFDLKRGYVKVKDICDADLSLEAGRFTMAYGDERIIGELDWFDQGRTFDGGRLSYHPEDFFIDLFAVRIREEAVFPGPGPLTDDQDMVGVYGGTRMEDAAANFEGYVIVFRDQGDLQGEHPISNLNRHTLFATVGARLFGDVELLDYALEAAFQSGEVANDDLTAYAFSARAGLTLSDTETKPRIGVEINFASGDDDPTDMETETFQILFPTNHMHYGHADLAAWSNIIDFKVGFSFWPDENVKVTGDYHHFRLVDAKAGWINAAGGTIRDRDGLAQFIPACTDEHLGDEVDVTLTWKPLQQLTFLLGWAHFFDGQFVRQTGGGGDGDFFYLQSLVEL